MENAQTDKQHPGEATRVLAALAAMVFWAAGVSLIDPRFGIGAFLCAISVWLYWSDLLSIPSRPLRMWPWLGIIIIVIEIIVPGWLLMSKSWGAELPATAAVQEKPIANEKAPQPAPPAADPNCKFNGNNIVIGTIKGAKTGISIQDTGACNNKFQVDKMTDVDKGFEVRSTPTAPPKGR